jgi:hypothetical protein
MKHRLRWHWEYHDEHKRTKTPGGMNETFFDTEAEARAEAAKLKANENEHVTLGSLTYSVIGVQP